MMTPVTDLNIIGEGCEYPIPRSIKDLFPANGLVTDRVVEFRETIKRILGHADKRLIVIVGPCSIHNKDEAIEYAEKLAVVAKKVESRLFVVMRAFFAKPRTTKDWEGIFYDPYMNDTCDIKQGAKLTREIALEISKLGLPLATEALDEDMVEYIDDLASYFAIGARSVQSKIHKNLASGLTPPVGMKNTTDGNFKNAVNGVVSANQPQRFRGTKDNGRRYYLPTKGNQWAHVVLRGGDDGPNYDRIPVGKTIDLLREKKLLESIMIDCSHGNSRKDFRNQAAVLQDILNQRRDGNDRIVGVFLESNLEEGAQKIPDDRDLSKLRYGVSVTDSCIGFPETERLLVEACEFEEKTQTLFKG